LEGIVAVAVGGAAGSNALIGFGIDSFVETSSAVVVGWRFFDEIRGRSGEHVEQNRTARVADCGCVSLLILGL